MFFYSGTLNPIRKIDIVLNAFARLCEEEKDVFFVIAGDDLGNPVSIEELKSLSRSLSLNNVVFTGQLAYNELIAFHQACEIGICFIPQTPYFNNQPPTKLFEYMAAGLVIIATNTSANKEIIINGKNGFLCDDTVNDLCLCFKKVVANYRNISKEMIFETKKKLEEYSWEFIINHYIHPIYQKILCN